MKSPLITSFVLFVLTLSYDVSAHVIPFAFWKKTVNCTFNSAVQIDSTNVANYTGCDWLLQSGAVVTIKYTTAINISSLTIESGGTLTHFACTNSSCAGKINLTITGDANIKTGGSITAVGAGYLGSYNGSNNSLYGKTKNNGNGATTGRGGCHGGTTGAGITDECLMYDSVYAPTDYGSGGGGANSSKKGGNGGGAVRLNVGGTLTVDGTINVDGNSATGTDSAGGGAGGSIWLTAQTITSATSGVNLSAQGGAGGNNNNGSGAGGRIALEYTILAGTMAIDSTRILIGSAGLGSYGCYAVPGTLLTKQPAQTYGNLYIFGQGSTCWIGHTYIGAFGYAQNYPSDTTMNYYNIYNRQQTIWNFGDNEIAGTRYMPDITDNSSTTYPVTANSASGYTITAGGGGFSSLPYTGGLWAIETFQNTFDNVYIKNYGHIFAAILNVQDTLSIDEHSTLYGGRINAGSVSLSNSSVITPLQADFYLYDVLSSGLIKINATTNVSIDSTSKIEASSLGFYGANQYAGPSTTEGANYNRTVTGGSSKYSGGSHGGYGGYNPASSSTVPATPYDDLTNPILGGGGGGSDGSSGYGGTGGAVVILNVPGTLTLNGSILARGSDGAAGSGGGAGGTINITTGTLTSASTAMVLSAAGGNGSGAQSAGGGGGRIAIKYGILSGTMAMSSTMIDISGGSAPASHYGGSGTLYVKANTDTYGSVYFWNSARLGNYLQTPFPQITNQTFANISILNSAAVKQLSTTSSITSSATTVYGTNSTLYIPTNGTTGYGPWFVPGTTAVSGGGTISEY